MNYNSYDDDYIKLAASIPELKDKVHVNITGPTDKISWVIRFNIALDEESVSSKSMTVTDTNGYIMDTQIRYNKKNNYIIINPLESYAQNEYYILTISKTVRSANNQNLKEDIHILFKLKNNVISEFIILPSNIVVPVPKKRPPSPSKVYSFDKYMNTDEHKDWLPMANSMINPIIGAIGLFFTLGSLFIGIRILIFISALIAAIGVGHIVLQFSKPSFRSNLSYNRGVRNFNRGNYLKAERLFKRALQVNPQNEYAEYALTKISYYKD